METAEIKVTIRARAFHGILETIDCLVSPDGTVRVWQNVSGGHCYYTLCHSLSPHDIGRVLAAARSLAITIEGE